MAGIRKETGGATGIGTEITTPEMGILAEMTSEGTIPHVSHQPVTASLVTKIRKRKKESEYRKIPRNLLEVPMLMLSLSRISPRHSPAPSTAGNEPRPSSSMQPSSVATPTPAHEPQVELDLSTTPPPVEDTLAARRAKRQAILAKYAGIASISTSQTATPSPGPSSAAEPPTAVSAISDPPSQLQSVVATPRTSVPPDGFGQFVRLKPVCSS